MLLAGVTLLLAVRDPADTTWALWAVLLGFTFLSATQDIAIDGYAVDVSTPRHAGAINGMRVAAYRVALVTAGGLVLILGDHIGWRPTWGIVAGLFVLMAVLTFTSPRAARERPRPTAEAYRHLGRLRAGTAAAAVLLLAAAWRSGWSAVWLTLAVIAGALLVASFLDPTLLRWAARREMALVIAFTLLYKVGDSTLGRMVRPFWVDQGASLSEIGVVVNTAGMILTVAGALLGGWFTTRRGIFAGLLWFGILQAISNFGYMSVAVFGLGRPGLYGASVFESLTQGLGTAAFLAFLTNLCDRERGATQFALLSAVFALSRDVAGAFSGLGVEAWGYPAYFTFTALLAVPALLLLPWVRPRIRDADPEAATPAVA
jgi:PAT family beta-lactamase induction signal transducer AmpG